MLFSGLLLFGVCEASGLLVGDLNGLPLLVGDWNGLDRVLNAGLSALKRILEAGGVFGVLGGVEFWNNPRRPGDLVGVLLGLSKTLELVDSLPLFALGL